MRRFPVMIVAGLVCIVLGVLGSEWARRNPPEKPAPVEAKPEAPLTPEELTSTERLPDLKADTDGIAASNTELATRAGATTLPDDYEVPDAKPVIQAAFTLRNAAAHGNAAYAVLEEGKQGAHQTLVRVSADGPPKALAVHRPQVGALTLHAARLYWAEGGSVFHLDANVGGVAKGVVRFPRARVTSLGVHGDVLIATLVPRDHDPFSSDPVGAVVSVALKDGTVKLLAKEQIRPAEAGTDGTRAVWIAGYPSDLWMAELASAEAKQLTTRADGPVTLQDGFITYRHPVIGAPELIRLQVGAGQKVLATGEIDRVATSWGDVWYSVAGTIHSVDKFGENARVVAKLPRPVLELAVSDDAVYAVTRLDAGGHLLVRLPRSTPQGAR